MTIQFGHRSTLPDTFYIAQTVFLAANNLISLIFNERSICFKLGKRKAKELRYERCQIKGLNMSAKIKRNDICPCGSKKKYKKCCLTKGGRHNPTQQLELEQTQDQLKDKVKQKFGSNVVFEQGNSESIKMSEVIIEFADELLQIAPDDSAKLTAIGMACMAWNLSFFNEEKRNEGINQMNDETGEPDSEVRAEFKAMMQELIQNKLTNYAHINRCIIDYETSGTGNDFHLNVISTPEVA